MNFIESFRKHLKESDNSMKDKFIEFKRQVHSDFEQFEDGQLFNTDADGNVLCPYCGSGDIIKEE